MRTDREPSPNGQRGGAGRGLPRRARLLVGAVIVVGAVALAVRVPGVRKWDVGDLRSFIGLACALAMVELFPLRFRHATEVQYLSLTDALWVAGLLLLLAPGSGLEGPRPGVLTMAAGVGALVGQAVQRRDPLKSAYNIGQWLLGVTVAE